MMGYAEPLDVAGEGGSPGSLRVKIKCWNKFKLIYDDTSGGSEAGPGS